MSVLLGIEDQSLVVGRWLLVFPIGLSYWSLLLVFAIGLSYWSFLLVFDHWFFHLWTIDGFALKGRGFSRAVKLR